MLLVTALTSLAGLTLAQDPAEGWMAYAVGKVPEGTERITKIQMTWKVGATPRRSNAFFSPWFGMDPADNLNLVQPVNPWLGTDWVAYTEYFQWSPEDNSNSRQIRAQAGNTLQGTVTYDAGTDSYLLSQKNLDNGESSSQNVRCQSGKKYTIPYVVYEKTFPCGDYPPDGRVDFTDISIECDGKDCTSDVTWESKVKDDNCNMKAVINSQTAISITWDTSAKSKYDDMTDAELFDLNYKGWATRFNLKRPAQELTFNKQLLAQSQDNTTHYEDPKGGCQADELAVQITGVDGDFCSPKCTTTACPTDVPTGVTATPQCALSSASSTDKYCALICQPGANDDQCGTNASCKSIQGVGICTYDD